MDEFKDFLQELCINTNIEFRLTDQDGSTIFTSSKFNGNSKMVYIPIHVDNIKAVINIEKQFEACTGLLKFIIESKIKELHSVREQALIDILEDKDTNDNKISDNLTFITKGCNLLVIYIDGNVREATNIIKEIYNDEEVISLNYNNNILILGNFEDVQEHANGIQEAITSNIFSKCHISYSDLIYNKAGIRKAYKECKESIMLVINYNLKGDVLSYNKLLFEKVVYSINNDLKQELLDKFGDKFDAFDNEMITTIEEFVNCGLNISDAARKIYIHRNTLIYRLDKIKKETGFDIRNFKEATVFIIAFLVWKDKN